MFVVQATDRRGFFWTAVAKANDGKTVDQVFGVLKFAARFPDRFDATLIARQATHFGYPTEVIDEDLLTKSATSGAPAVSICLS